MKSEKPQLIVAAVGRPPHFFKNRIVRLSAESRYGGNDFALRQDNETTNI